jgi:hypothetical protein
MKPSGMAPIFLIVSMERSIGARIVVTPKDHLVRQSSLPHPLISRVNTASESLFIRDFEKHLREY